MEIQCENTYSKELGILTSCVVTEPDGTRRDIWPLYYGQMIRKYKGRFFYVKDMPVDYFNKAKILEDNGWATWYHYDNWIKLSEKNTDYSGIKTNEAIRKCLITASTSHEAKEIEG
jgi:hypothetical protein